MRTAWYLVLAALLVAGCADSSGNEPEAEQQLERLESQVRELEQEKDSLYAAGVHKDDIFRTYTQLINQTLHDIEGLTEREGILRQIRIDVEEGEEGNLRTIEDRLNDNLAAIENYIRESKRQREELQRMLEERDEQQLPQANLEQLQTTINRLNALVEEKERTIATLRQETQALLARVDTLQQQNQKLATRNTELRQAYYVIGTQDELEQRGIIKRDGGILGIGRTTRVNELDPQYFTSTDVSLAEIFVGWNLSNYEVLSDHRGNEHLYAFQERDGETYLSIADPEAFWQIARYLVVKVER